MLTSLMVQNRILISGEMGFLQQAVGWCIDFVISILAMIPVLLLLTPVVTRQSSCL